MTFVFQEMRYNLNHGEAKTVRFLVTDCGKTASLHFSGYALGGGCTIVIKKHDTEKIEALEKLIHLLKSGTET